MLSKEDLIQKIGILQTCILKLKKDPIFNCVDFSSIENIESIVLRVYDCPMWYNWKEKTITSILGFKTQLNDSLANRMLKLPVSLMIKFPEIENDGKKIKINVSCYMYLDKPVYKYSYTTDNLTFSQSNLNHSTLINTMKSLMTNKPITRKTQISGFMNRLNSLSPNFGKTVDFD